tara:strand:+ start:358 stop:687 length:330 start_codon:yes stop_codon:yes gene_type:complete
MRLGTLTSRVELRSTTSTRDDVGQVNFSYSSEGVVWAHIEQAGASNVTMAEGIQQLDTYRITIPFDPSVAPQKGWRVYWGASKILEVDSVIRNTDTRDWVELIASEMRP